MTNQELLLRSEIAYLQGQIQGLTMWQHNPVFRRALLEKLLIEDGYSQVEIAKIIYRRKSQP